MQPTKPPKRKWSDPTNYTHAIRTLTMRLMNKQEKLSRLPIGSSARKEHEQNIAHTRAEIQQLQMLQRRYNQRTPEGIHAWGKRRATQRNLAERQAHMEWETHERKARENAAFKAWWAREQERTAAQHRRTINASLPAVPSAHTPAFQSWMKRLFSTRHAQGAMPTLLRYMRIPGTRSAHDGLAQLLTAATASEDPCKQTPHPDRSSIQTHQAVVHVMAQLRAQGRIDTSGLLVMHSTGAGKTLTGLAVMLAFWNTKVPILLVSTNDNRVGNDLLKFAELGMLMFADFVDEAKGTKPFARPPGAEGEYWRDPRVKSAVADAIAKRLQQGIQSIMHGPLTPTHKQRTIYTFAEMGNDLMNGTLRPNATQCVFIVDEIQYLVSPPATEQHFKPQYKAVWNMLALQRDPGLSWCVGMTATPGETKEEVVLIMNAIQGPLPKPMATKDTIATLRTKAAGYVSYAYLLGDRTRFASVRMRMICSFLLNDKGQKSYYHDPYFRRLHRSFFLHNRLPNNARTFLKNMHDRVKFDRRPHAGKAHAQDHIWEYGVDPAKTDAFHRPLRMLTLFTKLDQHEFKHLKETIAEADENNLARNTKGPIPELHVGVSRGVGTSTLVNHGGPNTASNSNNEDGNLDNSEFNQLYIKRSKTNAARASNRERRGVRLFKHRFLLSPKIPQLLSFIFKDLPIVDAKTSPRTTRGIHYVYTSNPTTALLVAHALSKVLGMPHLKRAQDFTDYDRPYFVMLDDVTSTVDILQRFQTRDYKKQIAGIKALIDAPENAFGDNIKVVIATKKSFKGVDLKHIRYLHLLEPMVNFRDFIQFVGRGPRYCSHHKHAPSSRFVEVVLYRLLYSPSHNCDRAGAALPDCFVWNEAYRRYFGEGKFNDIEDKVLWESSVDYELFKDNLHRSRDALKRMVSRVKCNTLHPFSELNAPNKNYKVAERHDGFEQLKVMAKERARKQLRMELTKTKPPKFNSKETRDEYTRFSKTLQGLMHALHVAQNDETDNRNAYNAQIARAQQMINNHRAQHPMFAKKYNYNVKASLVKQYVKRKNMNVVMNNIRRQENLGNALATAKAHQESNARAQLPVATPESMYARQHARQREYTALLKSYEAAKKKLRVTVPKEANLKAKWTTYTKERKAIVRRGGNAMISALQQLNQAYPNEAKRQYLKGQQEQLKAQHEKALKNLNARYAGTMET